MKTKWISGIRYIFFRRLRTHSKATEWASWLRAVGRQARVHVEDPATFDVYFQAQQLRTKFYGGKRYIFFKRSLTYPKAEEVAQKFRSMGRNARVHIVNQHTFDVYFGDA